MDLNHAPLAADLEALARRLRAATVHIRSAHRGAGSGVIWGGDGLIVTNAHVTGRRHPKVELSDEREFAGQLVAVDEERDLAALRIDALDLPALRHADSDDVNVGQLVVAMGNPLGISSALTAGIIHAVGKKARGHSGWIQADIDLAPGNSGGPLADVHGHVIGINSMVAGGLGLAVPSNAVVSFLAQTSRPRLGISTQPVDVPFPASGRSRSVPGLLVLEVAADGPADIAGLAMGDVIAGLNGRTFTSHRALGAALSASDDPLEIDIIRGGVARRIIASTASVHRREAA